MGVGHKGTLTAILKTRELSTISLSLGRGRKILEEREKVEEFKEWGVERWGVESEEMKRGEGRGERWTQQGPIAL